MSAETTDHEAELEKLVEVVQRAGLWANLPDEYPGSGTLAAFEAGKRAAVSAILDALTKGKPHD